VNYKRKSRRRLFLLMRSRTPPISSEFRGGGSFEHPKPPPLGTPLILRMSSYYIRVMVFLGHHTVLKATRWKRMVGQFHALAALTTLKRASGSHCVRGSVGLRNILGALEKREVSCSCRNVGLVGLGGPGFESWQGQDIILFSKTSRLALRPVSLLVNGYQGPCVDRGGRSVKLTTHLIPVPRLRTNEAVPLFSPYAFMAWAGKALLYTYSLPFIPFACRESKRDFSVAHPWHLSAIEYNI